jgi:DNA (cytosine-5)-methyltransferase 1
MIKLLYIDLFCGAGGTSTGVESARLDGERCAKVIACVNHDKNAIASHAANHPDALHFTEDIRTLELSPLVAHIENMKAAYPDALVVLWASLECTNFSKAKGGKPRDADSRTLAEHLFRYIETIDPDYIQIENVEEFMSWGDLDKNGKPVSKRKGSAYILWLNKVCGYSYDYDFRILNAADFGAYTSRKRYFGIFAKQGLPIVFPNPTHAKNPQKTEIDQLSLFEQEISLERWKPVKDCLDFSDEGESIFTRIKDLSPKTLWRILAGLIKFVAGGKDKWLLKYNSVNGVTGKHIPPSIDEPCPTVSCQGRLGVVQAQFISKHFSGHPDSKNKSIEEPAGAVTTIDHHSLISANFLARYNGQQNQEVNAVSIEQPAPTLTIKDRLSIISPKFMMSNYSNGDNCSSIENPCGTIVNNPKQNIVSCEPWIMNTNFSNIGSTVNEPSQTITANRKHHYLMNPQYASAGGSVDDPCFTLIARMDKMPPYLIVTESGQVAIEVYETDSEPMRKIKEFMALYGIIDIKMRMLKIPELKRIMGFPADYTLIGTKTEQKKYIGNAVEVNMARVICEALAIRLSINPKK